MQGNSSPPLIPPNLAGGTLQGVKTNWNWGGHHGGAEGREPPSRARISFQVVHTYRTVTPTMHHAVGILSVCSIRAG